MFYIYDDKAVALKNVKEVEIYEGSGKSTIRYSVHIEYFSGDRSQFYNLTKENAQKVFKEILNILNGGE